MYDEQGADLLLIDEHKGRSVAKQPHVRHIGTAGILMLAYDKNIIQAEDVKSCIDTMIANGIRLDKKICNIVMTGKHPCIVFEATSQADMLACPFGDCRGVFDLKKTY